MSRAVSRFVGVVLLLAAVGASPPADPHEHLRQILDRPLYRAWRDRQSADDRIQDPRQSQWLDDLRKRIDDFFDWLFGGRSTPADPAAAGGGSSLPTVLKAAAWVVLALGLIGLIVLVVRTMNRTPAAGVAARVLSREQVRDALETGDALALGSAGWIDEADRLAAERDFRAVYRALYLALLSGLHTAGKIEHRPTRTNWTYVDRYRGPADERRMFGDLTDVFDRVWYGRLAAPADDLPALRGKVATLTRTGA